MSDRCQDGAGGPAEGVKGANFGAARCKEYGRRKHLSYCGKTEK